MKKQQYSGKATSVNHKQLPALFRLVDKLELWKPRTINIDLGCGAHPENVTEFLATKKIHNVPLDPHWGYDPSGHEEFFRILPVKTVTISNVLNVIKEESRRNAVLRAAYLSLETGFIYITVYEGDKSGRGRETKPDCWQCNRKTDSYLKEMAKVFGKDNVYRRGKLLYAFKE